MKRRSLWSQQCRNRNVITVITQNGAAKTTPPLWNGSRLKAHGPATAKVIGIGIGKSDQAVRCSIEWHNGDFVELGKADDSRHSTIYGLPGQTLNDVTVNCNTEYLYDRISKYLVERGEGKVPEIARAVGSTNSRVSSCLSSYRSMFQNTQVGKYDFIWRLKEAA